MASKPRKYVIELGLDGDLAPRSDGTYLLSYSLVEVEEWDSPEGRAQWSTKFEPGDQMIFRIFDYTQKSLGKGSESDFVLCSFMAEFRDPAKPDQPKNPFSGPDATISTGGIFQAFSAADKKLTSPVTGAAHGWLFGMVPSEEISVAFKNVGRYTLTISVETEYRKKDGALEHRHYGHDPEIFVGEGSGPPAPMPSYS